VQATQSLYGCDLHEWPDTFFISFKFEFSQQLLQIIQNCTVNKQNLKQSHLCTLCCYGTEMILSKFVQN